MAIIEVDDLSKTFTVPVREQGLRASVRSLVHRQRKEVTAVDLVSFTIEPGEVVGFLGPNGAGKTTTLKMLSGLLHPTGGRCRVLGFEPKGRPGELLRQITLLMGNRNQLQWDLPALDSFELNRAIIPLAFAITVPSEAVTGRLAWESVAVMIGFTVVLMVISRWCWKRGLRRYDGASA